MPVGPRLKQWGICEVTLMYIVDIGLSPQASLDEKLAEIKFISAR
jgi:hypothetical protein